MQDRAWLLLLLAGICEVGWAVGLKYSEGFTRLWPSIGTLLGLAGSFWLLNLSMRTLPVGTAYAVWTGIGAVGTAVLGMLLFAEPRTVWRYACLALIVAGIAGLRLAPEKAGDERTDARRSRSALARAADCCELRAKRYR